MVCRSPKTIWCEEQSWTEVRAMWGGCPHPCRQGTWGRMQLYLQLLPIWPSDNKTREKRVIPAFWFSFCRWQSLRFSECFDILPCSIVANICRTYSNSLFDLCWTVSSLGSDPPFSLFFFLVFAHLYKVEWHSWIPSNLIYSKMFNYHKY